MDPLVRQSHEMIRAGSKSFAGAAALLPPASRDGAFMLYAWCRYCDDRIDAQDLGRGGPADAGGATSRLHRLEADTRRALAGERVEDVAFAALQRVMRDHSIPTTHPLELLQGFAMDVEGREYRSLDDTLDYCYHVAGVVGLMMAHVMNARSPEALDRATDLGLAFQLTNIARDVMDDAAVGRVYLPLDWLDEADVAPERLTAPENRPAVAAVVRRLLAQADRYYDSAEAGLSWLDFRCAWSIAAARRIYREIGRVVEARGARAWDERAHVGSPRKAMLALGAATDALRSRSPGARTQAPPRTGLWHRPQS